MSIRVRSSLLLGLLACFAAGGTVEAQAVPDREAILAVVKRLFDGMRAGDSASVRAVFHPRAAFIGALEQQGAATVGFEDPEEFIKAVGTPQDGTLAAVWMDYSFYLGDRFSHCGVDAFLLAREGAEWKVVSLADTRRRQGCPDQPGS